MSPVEAYVKPSVLAEAKLTVNIPNQSCDYLRITTIRTLLDI